MNTFILDRDITAFYVTAISFPEGIYAAVQNIHRLAPHAQGRQFFGISRPENGGSIVYRAAATEISEGELESKSELVKFIITKGTYVEKIVNNYQTNIPAIAEAFQELIHHDNIDPDGYCVEWYLSESDVRCMVKVLL